MVISIFLDELEKIDYQNKDYMDDLYEFIIEISEKAINSVTLSDNEYGNYIKKIGDVYLKLSYIKNTYQNCKKSIEFYDKALAVFKMENTPVPVRKKKLTIVANQLPLLRKILKSKH